MTFSCNDAASKLEKECAAFLGEPQIECAAFISLSASLSALLQAAGVGEGDEVIATAHAGVPVVSVARSLGCRLKLVGIDPATLNIDVRALSAAVTPLTRVIIVTHFAGLAADVLGVLDIARASGLRVIEDATDALPATIEKEFIGTLGTDATLFNLHSGLVDAQCPVGMVATRHAGLACHIRDHLSPSLSARQTEAAERSIGEAIERQMLRSGVVKRFDNAFAELPLILRPHAPSGDLHAWQRYVLRRPNGASMDVNALLVRLRSVGIRARVPGYHFGVGQQQTGLNGFDCAMDLELSAGLTQAQADSVIGTVRFCMVH
jgi:dTDP-4-amino-4,6-dideoxygalactose transaminase